MGRPEEATLLVLDLRCSFDASIRGAMCTGMPCLLDPVSDLREVRVAAVVFGSRVRVGGMVQGREGCCV